MQKTSLSIIKDNESEYGSLALFPYLLIYSSLFIPTPIILNDELDGKNFVEIINNKSIIIIVK